MANAKVSDFRLDGPFNADVELRAEGKLSGRPVASNMSFSGKVDIGNGRSERMSAVIKQLRLEDSGRELRLSGKVVNLAAPKLDLSAKLSLSGSELASGEASGRGEQHRAQAAPTSRSSCAPRASTRRAPRSSRSSALASAQGPERPARPAWRDASAWPQTAGFRRA